MTADPATEIQTRGFYSVRPGRIGYPAGLALQERLLERRARDAADYLLLLEHLPVITCGRGSLPGHLLASTEQLAKRGIELHRVSRGGDVTYHGPGQLVGYPILYLAPGQRDLHRYLRKLEALLQRAAAGFGIEATTRPGQTGLWVAGRKLASIGVGVRRWITWHGFALNVEDRLDGFGHIVPCGLAGVEMTSLEACIGRRPTLVEVEEVMIRTFAELFETDYLGDYDDTTATQA